MLYRSVRFCSLCSDGWGYGNLSFFYPFYPGFYGHFSGDRSDGAWLVSARNFGDFSGDGSVDGVCCGQRYRQHHQIVLEGAKDILSAAIVVGLAGGIIQILQDGRIIDPILHALASLMNEAGRVASVGAMYVIQTLINIIIPSGSAKAALTMPIMAPFSDVIGISRQATVMAFQFGDGFTNMITPTSAVLIGALGIAAFPMRCG